jgi:hypothetical protein
MAELPRYQPTGYLPADVPRLDFANLKESVAMTQGINASLDRLSSFAFKEAEERAEREGLKFGVENRPSADQVMAALQAGKSPEELFAEPGTTFGNAARKIQAAQLRNELEVKARNEFANVSGLVESGVFNLEDVQGRIKAITEGYSRAISSVSPEEGLKFRASAGSAGAPVYAKAAERAYKMYAETQKVNADDLISQTPIIIGDLLSIEKDPVELAKRVNVERQRVFDIARATGDPQFFVEKRADFERALMGAIVDYTTTTAFAPNAAEGLRKIQMGDFGQLDRVMTKVNKDKLMKMYADRNGEIATAWVNTTKLKESQNIDKLNDIEDQFFLGNISGPQVILQAKALGIFLPDEKRKAFLSGDNVKANDEIMSKLESLAANQTIGENYVNNLATNKVIGWKQARDLNKIIRNDNPDLISGNKIIEFGLGIIDPNQIGMDSAKAVGAKLKLELARRQSEAKSKGEDFSSFNVANELLSTKEAELEIKKQKTKTERLDKKFTNNKQVYDPARTYTKEDLKRMGFPDSEINSILTIQKGSQNVR